MGVVVCCSNLENVMCVLMHVANTPVFGQEGYRRFTEFSDQWHFVTDRSLQ